MGHDSTPVNTARVGCSRCGNSVFFTFKGGPLALPCSGCGHLVRIEMVHDGRKWRGKDLHTARRETKSSRRAAGTALRVAAVILGLRPDLPRELEQFREGHRLHAVCLDA